MCACVSNTYQLRDRLTRDMLQAPSHDYSQLACTISLMVKLSLAPRQLKRVVLRVQGVEPR